MSLAVAIGGHSDIGPIRRPIVIKVSTLNLTAEVVSVHLLLLVTLHYIVTSSRGLQWERSERL